MLFYPINSFNYKLKVESNMHKGIKPIGFLLIGIQSHCQDKCSVFFS